MLNIDDIDLINHLPEISGESVDMVFVETAINP